MTLLAQVIVTALVLSFATQLVVHDRVFEAPRMRLMDWLATGGTVRRFFGDMLSCHRCAGIWLSAGATSVTLGRWPWTDGWEGFRLFAVVAAAASYSQFVLMQYADTLATEDDDGKEAGQP